MMLHLFGWNGSQTDISDVIKPVNGDRNVNPEEMAYWVHNYAGWLRMEYRVGGDLETLKRLIASGYPVIIEGTTSLNPDDTGWPDDDLWAAHYLLLTAYDDSSGTFTAQDPYRGPDKQVSYEQLEAEWKPFNYLYMVVYLPGQEEAIQRLLGSNWDPDLNRQNALSIAETAVATDPSDAFAWFNVGSNLVYFARYEEANAAYDKAREIGLPQRMFRYQFGPFPRQLPRSSHRRPAGADRLRPAAHTDVRGNLALAWMGALPQGRYQRRHRGLAQGALRPPGLRGRLVRAELRRLGAVK
jgi:tetratricopeptide (TPR) repeat protein